MAQQIWLSHVRSAIWAQQKALLRNCGYTSVTHLLGRTNIFFNTFVLGIVLVLKMLDNIPSGGEPSQGLKQIENNANKAN